MNKRNDRLLLLALEFLSSIILPIDKRMSRNKKINLSGLNVQWEWEGDKSVWQQYPVDIQQQISQAFDAGNSEVKKENFSLSYKSFYFLSGDYPSNGRNQYDH